MAFEMDLLVFFVVAVAVQVVSSLSRPLNSKLSLHEHVYGHRVTLYDLIFACTMHCIVHNQLFMCMPIQFYIQIIV